MTIRDVPWTAVLTLGDLLVRAASQAPEQLAVALPERSVTYAALLAGARRVARSLVAIGVKRGQHVGVLMPNGVEAVEALFGIALAGAVVVPLHARHKGPELRYVVDHADLVAVLTSSGDAYVDFAEVLVEAFPSASAASGQTGALHLTEAPRLRHLVVLSGTSSRSSLLGREAFLAAGDRISERAVDELRGYVKLREPALVLYTSGTTAKPKGCILSHEAVVRGPSDRATWRLRTGEHDVHYSAGPLYHIATLAALVGAVSVAGTFLCDTFFEPGRAIALLKKHEVTVAFPWFSAIVQALLDHPSFDPADFAALRHFFIIAPPALVRRVIATLPSCEVIQGCGMTEAAGIFAMSAPDDDAETRATTQGKPWRDVEMRVRRLDSADGAAMAPIGTIGELLLRGPCTMDGYYKDPEKTAATFDEDGFIRTGDLYLEDANGNYLFQGRLKDMLKVGGENVAVVEIESVLCDHPAVKLAEVVGLPDARLDEVPVAFVELRTEAKAEELIDFCRSRIARYKVPRAVFFVKAEEWPMSATKVDKGALRRRAIQAQR